MLPFFYFSQKPKKMLGDFPRYYENLKTLAGKTSFHFTVISRISYSIIADREDNNPYFRVYPRSSFYPLIIRGIECLRSGH